MPYKNDPATNAADKTGVAAFAKCVGKPNSDLDQVAEANSDDFDQGDAEISSDASSYRSQRLVDSDIAALHSPKASLCFEQVLKATITAAAPEATIESVTFKITPGSAGGPANVIANGAGTFKIGMGGNAAEGYFSNAFIFGPMIEANVTAISTGAPVSTSLVESLAAAVANRAAHH
jgi:hypothetical protein